MNNDFPPRMQTQSGTVDHSVTTRALPAVDEASLCSPRDTAALAGVLLPQEHAVLSARPHPIVWIRPAIRLGLASVALVAIALFKETPIIAGHHRTLFFVSTDIGRVVLAGVAIFWIAQLAQLVKQIGYFFGFRIVATNRRVFVVRSLLDQSIRPLGNTGMARSSLKQGLLGRLLGYGTIVTGEGVIRDMRFPVALWRSLEAVAHGVENGEWKPAVRQTLIP